jgi:hypothetical protein
METLTICGQRLTGGGVHDFRLVPHVAVVLHGFFDFPHEAHGHERRAGRYSGAGIRALSAGDHVALLKQELAVFVRDALEFEVAAHFGPVAVAQIGQIGLTALFVERLDLRVIEAALAARAGSTRDWRFAGLAGGPHFLFEVGGFFEPLDGLPQFVLVFVHQVELGVGFFVDSAVVVIELESAHLFYDLPALLPHLRCCHGIFLGFGVGIDYAGPPRETRALVSAISSRLPSKASGIPRAR